MTLTSAGLSFPIYNQKEFQFWFSTARPRALSLTFFLGKFWVNGSFRDLGVLLSSCRILGEPFIPLCSSFSVCKMEVMQLPHTEGVRMK